MPASPPRAETATIDLISEVSQPVVAASIERLATEPQSRERESKTRASPVVSQRDTSREASRHDMQDASWPPPAMEYEPTIEPAEFNQEPSGGGGNPVIPEPSSPTDLTPDQLAPEGKEAGGNEPRERIPVSSKPVATDAIHWTELSYDLGLQGFAQAIATNSVVGNYEQNHLQLFLTPDFMKFVNAENQDEICQAIASKLGLSLILDLQIQEKLDAETPSETRLRKQQEHRLAAIESIKQEQTVKKLQRAFGAELVESSVQLIEQK